MSEEELEQALWERYLKLIHNIEFMEAERAGLIAEQEDLKRQFNAAMKAAGNPPEYEE
jgi:hypothetical protein